MKLWIFILLNLTLSDSMNCVPLSLSVGASIDIWDDLSLDGKYSLKCYIIGDNPIYKYPLTGDTTKIKIPIKDPIYCIAQNDCSTIIGKYINFNKKNIYKIIAKSEYPVAEGGSMKFQLVDSPYLVSYSLICYAGGDGLYSTNVLRGYIFMSNVHYSTSGRIKMTCYVFSLGGNQIKIPPFYLVKSTVSDNFDQYPPKNVLYNKTDYINCFFSNISSFRDITYETKNGVTTCKYNGREAKYVMHKNRYYSPANTLKDCLVHDQSSTCIFNCVFYNASDGSNLSDKIIWHVDGVVQSEIGNTLKITNRRTSGSVTCRTSMSHNPNVISSARIIYQISVKFAGTLSSMSLERDANATMKCLGYINDAIKDKCQFRFYFNSMMITDSPVYKVTSDSHNSGTLFVQTKNLKENQTLSGNYQCAIYCPFYDALYKSENFYVVYSPEQTNAVRSSSINWSSIIAALVVLGISFIVIIFFIYRRKCRGSSYNVSRMEKNTHGNLDPSAENFKLLEIPSQTAGARKYESSMMSENDSLEVYSDRHLA